MKTFSMPFSFLVAVGTRGIVVVKALPCKPEGCGFETRRGERMFQIYLILPAALGPWGFTQPLTEICHTNILMYNFYTDVSSGI
jgi:hypothetical protein